MDEQPERVKLLTIKTSYWVRQAVIPNDDEATVNLAINYIRGSEDYIKKYCEDWKYKNGSGRYFDWILNKDVTVDVDDVIVLNDLLNEQNQPKNA